MFAEHLYTPHPSIVDSTISQEPLLQSVRLRTVKAAFEASDRSYDDQVEAAYAAANIVRQTLRFQPSTALQPRLDPEQLARSPETNCHGHSIVTSEVLETIGVDHYIGFSNNHSYILLQEPVGGQVNLVDTAVKQMYADITPALSGKPFHMQPDKKSRVNTIRGDIIALRSNFTNHAAAMDTHPWMSFAHGKENTFRFRDDDQLKQAHSLMLRTYDPQDGRAVVHAYANLVHVRPRAPSFDADINRRRRPFGRYRRDSTRHL